MATSQNISVFQGNSLTITVTCVDAAGAAKSLIGAAITWALGAKAKSAPTITKAIGSGVTVTDAAGGVFEVALDPADTSALSAKSYYHEAKVTDGGGRVATIMTGTATIKEAMLS